MVYSQTNALVETAWLAANIQAVKILDGFVDKFVKN